MSKKGFVCKEFQIKKHISTKKIAAAVLILLFFFLLYLNRIKTIRVFENTQLKDMLPSVYHTMKANTSNSFLRKSKSTKSSALEESKSTKSSALEESKSTKSSALEESKSTRSSALGEVQPSKSSLEEKLAETMPTLTYVLVLNNSVKDDTKITSNVRDQSTEQTMYTADTTAYYTHSTTSHIDDHITYTDDITIVSAYIDIGTFKKGSDGEKFSIKNYMGWMSMFQAIQNPLVFFSDSVSMTGMMEDFRSNLPKNMTHIHKISRDSLWSYSLLSQTRKIFSGWFYPRHHPNTVVAEYSCAQHAKYDFMEQVIQKNPFNTRYFSWLDVGYFRDLIKDTPPAPFTLGLPPTFNKNTVAYCEVGEFKKTISQRQVFYKNLFWLGGGMFIGHGDVLLPWIFIYRSHVIRLLKMGLASTDQQVLYCMRIADPSIMEHIQTFRGNMGNPWFYLGYLSKKSGDRRKNLHEEARRRRKNRRIRKRL